MHNKEAAWSSRQKKAITTPMPQISPLPIRQRAQRQPSQAKLFAKSHIWSDETKIELYGHNKVNKAYDETYTIHTVKHKGDH
ncbi:hypothetical protein JOB18_022527 [Solea senegalensis]|uniref:Transposase n=1 Tax=Solea senegalensis TaxID=28829 RepID=A0AAV6REQ3_SOLSE|nr:hypothetical protein JOB18_022527 [Solea senegalensis]